jgi:hypothetical protein
MQKASHPLPRLPAIPVSAACRLYRSTSKPIIANMIQTQSEKSIFTAKRIRIRACRCRLLLADCRDDIQQWEGYLGAF